MSIETDVAAIMDAVDAHIGGRRHASTAIPTYAALESAVTALATRAEAAEKLAASRKLGRVDQECLRTGQQLNRAAEELPQWWSIRVDVEHEAGSVTLYNPDGDEVHFADDCEGLSASTSAAIDAARQQEGSKG